MLRGVVFPFYFSFFFFLGICYEHCDAIDFLPKQILAIFLVCFLF